MINQNVDLDIWKQLKKKWADLDASGHQVKVEFKLITDTKDKNHVLSIDVVQKIDEEIITETVQHIAKEAYAALGIADVSMEQLKEIYRQTIYKLYCETGQDDATLIVTMSPTSPTSGEMRAVFEQKGFGSKKSIEVNYSHYYILNALREKMAETPGDEWSRVTTLYRTGALEFYFDY